jgi:hypothetical protein
MFKPKPKKAAEDTKHGGGVEMLDPKAKVVIPKAHKYKSQVPAPDLTADERPVAVVAPPKNNDADHPDGDGGVVRAVVEYVCACVCGACAHPRVRVCPCACACGRGVRVCGVRRAYTSVYVCVRMSTCMHAGGCGCAQWCALARIFVCIGLSFVPVERELYPLLSAFPSSRWRESSILC